MEIPEASLRGPVKADRVDRRRIDLATQSGSESISGTALVAPPLPTTTTTCPESRARVCALGGELAALFSDT